MILCLPFFLLLSVFRTILEKMVLQGKVKPQQAKKKKKKSGTNSKKKKKKNEVVAGLNDDVETKLCFTHESY